MLIGIAHCLFLFSFFINCEATRLYFEKQRENGNLSQKQCEIGKKCHLLCENGNLSEKQYEIGKKKLFDVRKR